MAHEDETMPPADAGPVESGLAALVLIVVVVLIGMHATWRDCTAAGGQTVRGLFWLECIK